MVNYVILYVILFIIILGLFKTIINVDRFITNTVIPILFTTNFHITTDPISSNPIIVDLLLFFVKKYPKSKLLILILILIRQNFEKLSSK